MLVSGHTVLRAYSVVWAVKAGYLQPAVRVRVRVRVRARARARARGRVRGARLLTE